MIRTVLLATLLLAGAACKSSAHGAAAPLKSPPTCREGVGDDVHMAGRTAGSAIKTGATTAVDGVKQAGSSAVTLVTGGTKEASERWHEKGNETKSTARTGGAETSREASLPPCKSP